MHKLQHHISHAFYSCTLFFITRIYPTRPSQIASHVFIPRALFCSSLFFPSPFLYFFGDLIFIIYWNLYIVNWRDTQLVSCLSYATLLIFTLSCIQIVSNVELEQVVRRILQILLIIIFIINLVQFWNCLWVWIKEWTFVHKSI